MEQIIEARITTDDAVGKMLPPEKELVRIFDVSRATVKKTLDNLVTKGLVERKRAVGTRVISQEITEDLARLKSYTEEMHGRHLSIRTSVLEVSIHVPDEHVRGTLELDEGEKTLCIRRLRGTGEVFPVVLLRSEIPERFGIDPGEDFSGSLYKLIEQKYQISIDWAEQEMFASRANKEQAKHLLIDPGDTVLVMERKTYTRGNGSLEFVRGVYLPEHYKFSIRLRR
jgi:GntR family transcriptional regulator